MTTIQGERERRPMVAVDTAAREIAGERGRVAVKGKTWKKSSMAKTVRPAIRKAQRAQKSPACVPGSWYPSPVLKVQPATANANNEKERLTQWCRFLR